MFKKGMKIDVLYRESPTQAEKKGTKIHGVIESVLRDKIIVRTNKKYATSINIVDFETGHAVLI